MQMLFAPGPESALQDLKSLVSAVRQRRLPASAVRSALRVIRRPGSVLQPAWHYAVFGRSYVPDARIVVGIACEQEPNPASRIVLGAARDRLGMPRAEVRWKLTDLTLHSLRTFTRTLTTELPRVGVGNLDLEHVVLTWLDRIEAMREDVERTVDRRLHDDLSPHGRVGHPSSSGSSTSALKLTSDWFQKRSSCSRSSRRPD